MCNHYFEKKFARFNFSSHYFPHQTVPDADPIRTERRMRLVEKYGVNGECGGVPLSFEESSEAWRQKVARGFLYYLSECKNLNKNSASAQQARNFFLRTHGRVSLNTPSNLHVRSYIVSSRIESRPQAISVTCTLFGLFNYFSFYYFSLEFILRFTMILTYEQSLVMNCLRWSRYCCIRITLTIF